MTVTNVKSDNIGTATPSGGENWVHSISTFLMFPSLQISFESVVDIAATKVNRLSEGIRFVLVATNNCFTSDWLTLFHLVAINMLLAVKLASQVHLNYRHAILQ